MADPAPEQSSVRGRENKMTRIVKKSIPWFLVILLFGLTGIFILNSGKPATQASTEFVIPSVEVGNVTPTWVAVYENPASATTTPTNVGSAVTFQGKADDPNGDAWYLLICTSSAQIATTSDGTCPVCPDGTWATSTAADNATATATYTTLSTNAENNAWYAWACDNNSNDQKCTASSTGTGATDAQYSPFAVNHQPGFTALAGTTPIDPGGTVGISASSTDSDSAGSDWVQLTVCWSSNTTISGWGASGACASGGTLCAASSTANPTCNHTASSTLPDTTYTYYGYIVDNHSFSSSPATRSATFVVNNKAPTVSNVKLNNDEDIDLSEGNTYNINLTADLSDENSCSDLSGGSATTTGRAYRTASSTVCTAQNDNFCYYNISCDLGPCGGVADADATTSCTIAFWYYTDPTAVSTNWAADTWTGLVKAIDNDNASSTATSTAVEMNGLLALDVDTETINYGYLSGGQQTDPLNVTSTLAETGNCSLDLWSTSTDMGGPGTIAVTYQRYSLAPVTAYSSGISASTTDVEIELNLAKTTASTTQATSSVYWGLAVPGGTPSGVYTGYTKYEAKLNELPW